MKIVAAPNAFKGSVDGIAASAAIRRGIMRISPDITVECVPVADGGDGLVDILAKYLGGKIYRGLVAGPLFNEIEAEYCYIEQTQTGVVEMAKASGLALLEDAQKNPERTTTLGTGELIVSCLNKNVKRLIIGIGGSATCDGGIGAAHALGYRFLDKLGNSLEPVGGNLSKIRNIDSEHVDKRLFSTRVEVVCDVANTISGPDGASYVYSPQKGADDMQVKRLDEGLRNLTAIIKKDLGVDVETLSGGGAAGGLGAGLYAFAHGNLEKGIDLVMDIVGLENKIQGADLVITGEGRIDSQTANDKAPAGVAKLCRKAGVSCVAICGSIDRDIEQLYDIGIDSVFSICDGPMTLEKAVAEGELLLEDAAERVVRLFCAARK